MQKYSILITTGIYTPDIGGPAKYAEMLFNEFSHLGYQIKVRSFSSFLSFPTLIRHFLFFIYIIIDVIKSDYILTLDTYSVALPTILASKIFGKKIVIRVGGDFLWETYTGRTKEVVRLSDFYKTQRSYNLKEKIIFKTTQFLFDNANKIVFSTNYQKDIEVKTYNINKEKISVIENLYKNNGRRNIIPKRKIIFSGSRKIFLKNQNNLITACEILKKRFNDIILDNNTYIGDDFLRKLKDDFYCVVVPSFSEISPNVVLDAISYGIPSVVTEDCGIEDRIKDLVVWIKPEDPKSIADGIEKLLDAKEYNDYMSKMSKFEFVHTENQIAKEFLEVFENLK